MCGKVNSQLEYLKNKKDTTYSVMRNFQSIQWTGMTQKIPPFHYKHVEMLNKTIITKEN